MPATRWTRLFRTPSTRSSSAARLRLDPLEDRDQPSVAILPTNANGKGYVGLDFNRSGGYVPPDTDGAAGPTAYVETVNQTVGLYPNKATGAGLKTDSFSHFWYATGGLPQTDAGSFLSDPIVTYDDQIGRFIIGDQDVEDVGTNISNFDIAVSKTSNPTTLTAADWNFYQISTTESGFDADYPGNFGYNADAFVFTLNMFPTGAQAAHVLVTSVSSADLAKGVGQADLHVFHNDSPDNWFSLRPATMHDAAPGDPMWLVAHDGNFQSIDVIKMTNVLSDSAGFALTNLPVTPYGSANHPLNPNGTEITNNIDSRILKAAVRDGHLVATHSVGVGGNQDDAQWYDINITGATPTLNQQGRVGFGANTYVYYPAIDINPAGQLGMSYMKSGTDAATDFMSVYITGRNPGDPAGTMLPSLLVPAGAGQGNYSDFTGGGRAGDLSGINVDPTNGSFWAANEFATADVTDNWGTAIANFNLAGGVTAKLSKGTLILTGASSPDQVELKVVPGGVQVTGLGATTVNGTTGVTLTGKFTGVSAKLGGGDDALSIDPTADFVLTGPVTVDLGDGTDSLSLVTTGQMSVGSLTVKGGTGSETVTVRGGAGSTIARSASVSHKSGATSVTVNNVTLSTGGVRLSAGTGSQSLVLAGVTATKGASSARTRGGQLGAAITGGSLKSLSATASAGGSTHVTVAGSPTITGGVKVAGTDPTLTVAGTSLTAGSVTLTGITTAILTVGAGGRLTTTGDVAVRASKGAATLSATGTALTVGGGLTVSGSNLTDVTLGTTATSEVTGAVSVKGGDGNDSFVAGRTFKADGNVTLNLGDGTNVAQLGSAAGPLAVGGALTIETGGGTDQVTLTDTQVGKATKVALGAGTDHLTVLDGSTFTGTTLVDLGSGNDTLAIASTFGNTAPVTFTGAATLKTGADDDTIQLGLAALLGGNANTVVAFQAPHNTLDAGTGTDTYDPAQGHVTGSLTTVGLP